jgi:hypothetical protein
VSHKGRKPGKQLHGAFATGKEHSSSGSFPGGRRGWRHIASNTGRWVLPSTHGMVRMLLLITIQVGIGRVLVWACFVRKKFSPHLAYSDRKRAPGCSHATSKHRAASAGHSRRLVSLQAARSLCHAYGMHASRRHFWGSSFNDGTTQTARDPLMLGGRLAPLKSVYFGSNEGRGPVPSVQP